MVRWLYVGIWALLFFDAILLAPSARPDQEAWILSLLTGAWDGEEPWVVAHFMLMGVWPFVLGAQLSARLRRAPVPLWPFALGSMFLGAFVLLPGLFIGGTTKPESSWQPWLRHPVWVAFQGLSAAGLVGWAVVSGSPARWLEAFQTEQFVHVMAFDFAALWLTSILVELEHGGAWRRALVPLWGGAWAAVAPHLSQRARG